VESLERTGDRITAVRVGEREIEPSLVAWSGTLHAMATSLDQPPPNLSYLALLCYNVMLADGEPFDFQWCYHGAPDVIFSRVSVPASFSPGNTPAGRRSLCVEVTSHVGDYRWRDPDLYTERVVEDLIRERLIRSASEIQDIQVERVPWAYPIYSLDYREQFRAVGREAERFRNLMLVGRLGRFWYNNMDQCVEASMGLADEIEKRLTDEGEPG
jgi:protoporphyrinogen oxidase